MRVLATCVLIVICMQAAEARPRIVLLGGNAQSCRTQVQTVRASLSVFPLPENWTFVIACTPLIWDNLLRRIDGLGKTNTAFSNLQAQYTYFNGATFEVRVAAHELGHIFARTEDEDKAEKLGRELHRRRSTPAEGMR